ncbi:Delta(3,5)-Delta(2,4)-dienoyl-CoA isomerase, mitochondrial [Araneus ventricosus]|uniref:Delta(3,5)-Delta(2,4)-dienoyl-CoA isomerase, mitochondrial n=1 Tax=Araneus ventricosus TaxID=182803 RepID=A0A4Y2IGL2_ARAVE|nr:Delta(3,5)-Delta(2,4)-dienoyl-CoA isomerase, mitochondrial [Araneus ventricosus]
MALGTLYISAFRTKIRSLQRITRAMSSASNYQYQTLSVTSEREHVLHVQLNRPDRLNSMNRVFWTEILDCFNKIKNDEDCRVAVISGNGRMFSAGYDLDDMSEFMKVSDDNDIARKAKFLKKRLEKCQESFLAIENCQKPVVAAIHNACVGGAVDLVSTCDVRYCSENARFVITEIDIGVAADLGILQRLPKIVGNDSLLREHIYTCKPIDSKTAMEIGIVSKIFPTKVAMMEAALDLAQLIASKSPVAIQGTKISMNYSRDHTIQEGLEFIAIWNMAMLQSDDVLKAASAGMQKSKEPPKFLKF